MPSPGSPRGWPRISIRSWAAGSRSTTSSSARARPSATSAPPCSIEGRIETIEATAPDVVGLYRPLMERAAEVRLGAAFWRMVGPG